MLTALFSLLPLLERVSVQGSRRHGQIKITISFEVNFIDDVKWEMISSSETSIELSHYADVYISSLDAAKI